MIYYVYIIGLLSLLIYLPKNSKSSRAIKVRIIIYYLLFSPLLLVSIDLFSSYLNQVFDSQNSVLKVILTDFKIEFCIILCLLITIFIKYRQKRNNSLNNWKNFKDYILENKTLSIALSTLVVAIGMIGAGIVNYISADNTSLGKFNVAGITFLFLLCIGLYLITPLVNFKFKYNFISNYDDLNAKFIYSTYKKADNLRCSTKGILSIQLFEIHENTYDTVLSFKFKEIWSSKESNVSVNKIKNTKVDVPLNIWDFLKSVQYDVKLNAEFLNNFAISKKEIKNNNHKIYVEPIYLLALFDYLKESYFLDYIAKNHPELMKNSDLNSSITKKLSPERFEIIENNFEDWIEDWNIPKDLVTNNLDYKSIHYLTFFNLIVSSYVKELSTINDGVNTSNVNSQTVTPNTDVTNPKFANKIKSFLISSFKKIISGEEVSNKNPLSNHIYKGFYNKDNLQKSNRCYYNFSIKTSSVEEGQKNYIILMVCDNRFIPTIDSASSIFEIMVK